VALCAGIFGAPVVETAIEGDRIRQFIIKAADDRSLLQRRAKLITMQQVFDITAVAAVKFARRVCRRIDMKLTQRTILIAVIHSIESKGREVMVIELAKIIIDQLVWQTVITTSVLHVVSVKQAGLAEISI